MTPRLLRGVSRGQAQALGHQTPRSAAQRRRHGRQTHRQGAHGASRDSDSNRANRAREKVRAMPMPSASEMSGRAASVAARLRTVCEHAAAAAPILEPKMASGGGAWRSVARWGAGLRTQANGSERRARVVAAPEPARAPRAPQAATGATLEGRLGQFRRLTP